MVVRSTRRIVRIEQPLSLRGCAQVLEPGNYTVETDDQLLEGLSFFAYQRIKTFIYLDRTLGRPGVDRVLSVSGDDLDNAVRLGHAVNVRATHDHSASDADATADLDALDRADDEGMTRARTTD